MRAFGAQQPGAVATGASITIDLPAARVVPHSGQNLAARIELRTHGRTWFRSAQQPVARQARLWLGGFIAFIICGAMAFPRRPTPIPQRPPAPSFARRSDVELRTDTALYVHVAKCHTRPMVTDLLQLFPGEFPRRTNRASAPVAEHRLRKPAFITECHWWQPYGTAPTARNESDMRRHRIASASGRRRRTARACR